MRRSKRYAPIFVDIINNQAYVDMNAAMIDDLVKSLGRTYPEMVASGLYLPGGPPKGMFDDSDTLSMTTAPGVELGFWASNRRFEALFISLLEVFEGDPIYKGTLPYELKSRMSQAWILSKFGSPLESRAPFKMPIRGMTGGTDTYRLPGMLKDTKVVFKYNAKMEVEKVVFRLNEKAHVYNFESERQYGHLNGTVEAMLNANQRLAEEVQPFKAGLVIGLPGLPVPSD